MSNDEIKTFLELIHQVRVDPHDEMPRLLLADMLEESGRPGAVNRTAKHLRDGKMVLNQLDIDLIDDLQNSRSGWAELEDKRYIGDKGGVNFANELVLVASGVTMPLLTPNEYDLLWRTAIKHLDDLTDLEVRTEVQAVAEDRAEKKELVTS